MREKRTKGVLWGRGRSERGGSRAEPVVGAAGARRGGLWSAGRGTAPRAPPRRLADAQPGWRAGTAKPPAYEAARTHAQHAHAHARTMSTCITPHKEVGGWSAGGRNRQPTGYLGRQRILSTIWVSGYWGGEVPRVGAARGRKGRPREWAGPGRPASRSPPLRRRSPPPTCRPPAVMLTGASGGERAVGGSVPSTRSRSE